MGGWCICGLQFVKWFFSINSVTLPLFYWPLPGSLPAPPAMLSRRFARLGHGRVAPARPSISSSSASSSSASTTGLSPSLSSAHAALSRRAFSTGLIRPRPAGRRNTAGTSSTSGTYGTTGAPGGAARRHRQHATTNVGPRHRRASSSAAEAPVDAAESEWGKPARAAARSSSSSSASSSSSSSSWRQRRSRHPVSSSHGSSPLAADVEMTEELRALLRWTQGTQGTHGAGATSSPSVAHPTGSMVGSPSTAASVSASSTAAT